jgi:exosortase
MTTRTKVAVFAFFFLAATLLLWRPFITTLSRGLSDPESAYLLVILPVSLALIVSGWRGPDPSAHPVTWPGLVVLAAGLVTAIASWLAGAARVGEYELSLFMLALVLCWMGGFTLIFGAAVARYFLFPLSFLFWMVPMPSSWLASIIRFLQWSSAVSAAFLFSILGTHVSRDGIVLDIPNLTVEVAQECSSIRSSLVLVITTMVLAHLFLRSFWKQALLVGLSIPLAVAKNAVRIVTIALLGTRIDPSYLTGRLHHEGGIVFFSMALVAVVILLWFMRRSEMRGERVLPAMSPTA